MAALLTVLGLVLVCGIGLYVAIRRIERRGYNQAQGEQAKTEAEVLREVVDAGARAPVDRDGLLGWLRDEEDRRD